MSETLETEEVQQQAPEGWEQEDDELVRVFDFDDYLDGVSFAASVGEVAEEEFHHPTIVVRYEEVEVRLTTHDAGGITEKDIRLADLINGEY